MARRPKPPMKKHTSDDPYSLFDISGDMKLIIREICTAQEEKDAERVEELTCELMDLIDLHSDKYEATAYVILNSIEAGKNNQAISNQFQAKATAHNNLAKRLKQRLLDDMQQHGIKKVNTGIFTIREQVNGVASLEVEVPPEQLPEEFQKIEIDTATLRAALEFGEEVDGAYLKKGTHLRIAAKD